MSRKILYNLESTEYEHEFDRKALEALKKTPGLDFLVKKFFEYSIEAIYRIQYTGSNIKVSKNSFSEVYNLLLEACNILNITKIPDLYIEFSPSINGFTTGVDNPLIVLTSGCIDLLSEDELVYTIGHELGHIKSGHVLYHTMAQVLPILGKGIGNLTLGLGEVVSSGIQIALYNWQRKSEFTADRAGLLACQNHYGAIGALMKIAGIPQRYYGKVTLNTFIEQAREFQDYDNEKINKIAKLISIMDDTHPWTIMRTYEILNWVENGEYKKILDNH
jgi:Zn-dependent protease with chaperone function